MPHPSPQPDTTSPRWVAIQRNPRSGSGAGARELLHLIRTLRARGLRPRLYSRRNELDEAIQDPARRKHLAAVVAAGGDGTVLDLAGRCQGIPVAILPLGTENLLARAIGSPRCGRTVANMIAAGRTHCFDMARCQSSPFLVVASLGFDADVIHRAHARRKGRINRLFYVRPSLEALRKYRFPSVQVQLDDSGETLTGGMVVISNLPRYALGLPIAPQARGDDGLLDVSLFPCGGRWQLLKNLLAVLMKRQPHLKGMQIHRARRITVRSAEPLAIQVDGDPAGHAPAWFEVMPRAIEIIVPDSFRAG